MKTFKQRAQDSRILINPSEKILTTLSRLISYLIKKDLTKKYSVGTVSFLQLTSVKIKEFSVAITIAVSNT